MKSASPILVTQTSPKRNGNICTCLLSNDRSIIIKKTDKGLCVVVWVLEDYTVETSKQLNDVSVYKSVKFKDKVLRDLAEKINCIFKGLKQKCKITEKLIHERL